MWTRVLGRLRALALEALALHDALVLADLAGRLVEHDVHCRMIK